MISSRLSRRLVRHHLPIALLCLISGYFFYVTRPYTQIIPRLSFASDCACASARSAEA